MRLLGVRSLAWALLLSGWVGVGSLAQLLAPSLVAGFALVAVWLLAMGAFAKPVAALRPAWQRAVTVGAGLAGAWGLQSGSSVALLAALFASALAVALASAAVRASRVPRRAATDATPLIASVCGAVLAWAGVGDLGDSAALRTRLVWVVFGLCLALAALWPRASARRGSACRAALFDCSLPAWSAREWRDPQRWPLLLSGLVMLPLMGALPIMVGLCRSEAIATGAVLGLHFGAMFLPALALQRRHAARLRHAPWLCASLLIAGPIGVLLAPGAAGWWCLTLAHGAAWSVGWAARLDQRATMPTSPASTIAGASANALLVLLLGAAIQSVGLAALTGWHVSLAAGAAGAMLAVLGSNRVRALSRTAVPPP